MHKARPNEIRHVSINGGDVTIVIEIAHDSTGGSVDALRRAMSDIGDEMIRRQAPTVRARM